MEKKEVVNNRNNVLSEQKNPQKTHKTRNRKKEKTKNKKTKKTCQPPGNVPCRNPGLNQGPLDLQSNALPTELFRLTREIGENNFQFPILDTVWSPRQQITLTHIKTD